MKKIFLFFLTGSFLLVSCRQQTGNNNAAFNSFKERFIHAWWQQNPLAASSAGYHQFDSLMPAYDENFRKAEATFLKIFLDSLNQFEVGTLDPLNRLDHKLIGNTLRAAQFYADTFSSWQWDPSGYNVAGAFADIVNASNTSNTQKYANILARLKAVPAYYAAAKSNIRNPTAEHTQLAIEQSAGAIAYLQQELKKFCSENEVDDALNQSEILIANAVKAIEDYGLMLGSVKAGKDFRIGRDIYQRKFYHDIQSSLSAEEIYRKALKRKSELHRDMFELSKKLWTKYFREAMPANELEAVKMMIDKVSLNHVHRDSFMRAIEKQIPELTAFVKEKNLLYLDPDKPLKVRRTPAYMDGLAGASINAPGPYDSHAETFYNVSTLEKKTPDQAESYLREYNHYILQILNIHEAIPGHYAQLVYSNKAPSIIKSIFGNGAMVEGWAVYTERMILENGYGNNEPEMQLMYSKWHLRTVCNTILDYSVQVLGWNEEQALNLLMNEAFQQEAEAKGKWRRATLTQVQLCSYFTGYTEIYELREALKQKPNFDLKKFHEQFLSYGSAPVRDIAALMREQVE